MMLSLYLLTALPLVCGKATIDAQIAALESSNSPLLQYPTQLTQGIVPKQIHSHNDCASRYLQHTNLSNLLYCGRLEGRTSVISPQLRGRKR